MATYQNGSVKKATANTVTSMRQGAESRKCPQCERKSAMKFQSDALTFGSVCRWCGYSTVRPR